MGYRLTWKLDGDNTVYIDPKTFNSKTQVSKAASERLRMAGTLVTAITKEKHGLPESVVEVRSNAEDGRQVTAQGPYEEGTSVRLVLPGGKLDVYPGTEAIQTENGAFLVARKDNSTDVRVAPNGAIGYVVKYGAGFYAVKFPGVGVLFVPTYLLQPGDPSIDAIATIVHETMKGEIGSKSHFALGNGCVVKVTNVGFVRCMGINGAFSLRVNLSVQFLSSAFAYQFAIRNESKSARLFAQKLLDLTFFAHYGGTISVP